MKRRFGSAMERLREAHAGVPWEEGARADSFVAALDRWLETIGEAFAAALPEDRPALEAFADATGADLAPAIPGFAPAVYRVYDTFGRLSEHEDWHLACRRRSALEWVRELYRGKCGPDDPFSYPGAEAEGPDDLIAELSFDFGNLPDHRIPSYIPDHHWWWWAPDRIPAGWGEDGED